MNAPVVPLGAWHDVQSDSPGAPVRPIGGPPPFALTEDIGCERRIVIIKKTVNETRTVNLTVFKLNLTFLASDSVSGGSQVLIKASKLFAKVVCASVRVSTKDYVVQIVVHGFHHSPDPLV